MDKYEPFKSIICPICKKGFIYNRMSIYKLIKNGKLRFYCSYTCWRKDGGDGANEKPDPKIKRQLMGLDD